MTRIAQPSPVSGTSCALSTACVSSVASARSSLLPAIRCFVAEQLGAVTAGSEFASVEWDGVMADSDCRTPLLCLAAAGLRRGRHHREAGQ